MRALNETSEAQQAGDTIAPDRAAFRRAACQLEYEYQEPSAETASGRARTPGRARPATQMEYYNEKDLYRTYRLLKERLVRKRTSPILLLRHKAGRANRPPCS